MVAEQKVREAGIRGRRRREADADFGEAPRHTSITTSNTGLNTGKNSRCTETTSSVATISPVSVSSPAAASRNVPARESGESNRT